MTGYQRVIEDFQKAMFEEHDAEAVARLYAADAVYSDPALGQLQGTQAIKEAYEGFLAAFPDISSNVVNVIGSDNMLAGELKVRGTHTGPLELGTGNTVPATGRNFELDVCWIGRIDSDGLIAEDRTYYDLAGWMRQLGLLEQPFAAAA